MNGQDRRRKILEEAWVGDSVLALYARKRILTEAGGVDSARFERMTANKFLSAFGDASEVEARIGRVYDEKGIEAAFEWIESNLMPLYEKQEERRNR